MIFFYFNLINQQKSKVNDQSTFYRKRLQSVKIVNGFLIVEHFNLSPILAKKKCKNSIDDKCKNGVREKDKN